MPDPDAILPSRACSPATMPARSRAIAGWTRAGTVLLGGLLAAAALAQPPSPREHFGFDIGDDYQLANYSQTEAYFQQLAAGSERMRLVDIGRTAEGRSQWMLVVSSPANLARLEEYRAISARLARARDDEPTARRLAAAGKAVVWIDGGLHATETVGSHQLIQTAWELATREDAETRRILDDSIVLLVHANPDGQELVADWYMREPVPAKRRLDPIPRMYQKYAGHDNNRDFYMAALAETRNLNRVAYAQWYPQVLYNHHQTSPRGTVIVIPPYRDPFNYHFDALVPVGLESLGAAMNQRFLQEGKAGAVSKDGSVYSTWWNGGLRTMPYFHNMLGVLTEITGNPTPMEIPFLPERQLPDSNLPLPVAAQSWHFRQSIDYSLTANWAVLDYASRHREQLLFNQWRMGRNSIQRGSRDHWTPLPTPLEAASERARDAARADGGKWSGELTAAQRQEFLHRPETRDARGYILPSDQADPGTLVRFINALQSAGIEVGRARQPFRVGGRNYPQGSYVVRADQAFRPHVLDMFEPQDHPHDFEYAGGPPIAPYDSAGWTLALQMGIAFDRILEGFDGPFDPLPVGQAQQAPAPVLPAGSSHWAIRAEANDAFAAANALLAAGQSVRRDRQGRFIVAASPQARDVLGGGSGFRVDALPRLPAGLAAQRAPRIALWDTFGGSMPSGWTRLVLETFGFEYEVVYPQQIASGALAGAYDVLILPTGALQLPEELAVISATPRSRRKPDLERVPARYQHMLGDLEDEAAIAALRDFLSTGGHIVTTGSSSGLARRLGLPVSSHLRVADATAANGKRPLRSNEYFIPGSLLQVAVEHPLPVTRGMPARMDVYFSDGRWDNAPVFDLAPGQAALRPLLRFDSAQPLRSGWAWGQQHLDGGVLAFEADVGRGRLTAFGTDISFRSQMQGGFRLLFNALLQAGEAGEAGEAGQP